jgi:hypothetical protein
MNNVMVMTDAVVARGQRAWGRIKATAAEQRELWREVGEALLVGRRLHKADQKFSQWCKEMGFGDMHRKARANAMWWAEVGRDVTPPVDLTHPTNIRDWFNEQKTTSILPVELAEVEAEKVETIELDQRAAERVAKVINRAKANDEGAEIAKRHVEALAKKHNTTPEKLEEAAAAAAPTTFFQFPPAQVQSLTEFRQDLMQAYKDMLSEGIPKEAVIAIYMNVINEIKKGE